MSRELIAYMLMAVLVVGIGTALFILRRNSHVQRYRRASRRRIAVREHEPKS